MSRAKYETLESIPEELHVGDYPIATANAVCGAAITALAPIGRVTATGKVIASVAGAADGSETPIGIAAYETTAADQNITYFASGGYDPTHLELGAWTGDDLAIAFDRTPVFIVEPGDF